MRVAFTALETFDPSSGESWENYTAWSKLFHLHEVVSHDSVLCPSIIKKPTGEDWAYMACPAVSPYVFSDLNYLLRRVESIKVRLQIIATVRKPEKGELKSFTDTRFEFKGFDLIEEALGMSALTNCGALTRLSLRQICQSVV